MAFDALRASALDVQFDLMGVAITVTRPAPDNDPIQTTGIWLRPFGTVSTAGHTPEETRPVGTDLIRRDPRRVLALPRSTALPSAPRGTTILAPELDGGEAVTWRVDGYEGPVDVDLMRVLLLRVTD